RGARVHAAERLDHVARSLDETGVAALSAAARGDAAEEPGGLVRPYDHPAAVAGGARIGADDSVRTDHGLLRVLNVGIGAVRVAADENRSAARVARGVDHTVADDSDAHAERLDRSALAGAALCFDGSGDEVGAALRLKRHSAAARSVGGGEAARVEREILGGHQPDLAVRADHGAVRLHHAALAHQSAEHADAAGVGDQLPYVERLLGVRDEAHRHEGGILGNELYALACGEHDLALRGADDARVLHVRAHQEHPAARPARARVDDAGVGDCA